MSFDPRISQSNLSIGAAQSNQANRDMRVAEIKKQISNLKSEEFKLANAAEEFLVKNKDEALPYLMEAFQTDKEVRDRICETEILRKMQKTPIRAVMDLITLYVDKINNNQNDKDGMDILAKLLKIFDKMILYHGVSPCIKEVLKKAICCKHILISRQADQIYGSYREKLDKI